jgi:diacylglycerol kinase (ATP)
LVGFVWARASAPVLLKKIMKKKFFSVNTWMQRFGYAFRGIITFFCTEHNAWIYLFSTIAVTFLSLLKGVTQNESIALVIVTGLVWIAELFNTAIERIADMISVKYDSRIKIIKDVAAGAVLLSAITALITGLLIFIPKFYLI